MPTRKELSFLLLGIAGAVILYFLRDDWWRIVIFNYCFAMVFESSMEPLFTYHKDLCTARCIRNTDINYIFPIGWNFMFVATYWAATSFFNNRWYGFAVSGFIVGTILESIYHGLGFWKYNYDAKFGGFYKPFQPKITWLGGVPVQVSISYGLSVGTFVWFITNKMFQPG